MPASQAIVYLIICCVVFIALMFFGKPMKVLFKTAAGAVIGAAGMVICNSLLSPLGISVGINALTLLVVGVLGAPGFVTLYVSSSVL